MKDEGSSQSPKSCLGQDGEQYPRPRRLRRGAQGRDRPGPGLRLLHRQPQRAASRLPGGGLSRRACGHGRRHAARLYARPGPPEPAQGHRGAALAARLRALRLAAGLRHDGRLRGAGRLRAGRAAAGREGDRLCALFHGVPRLYRGGGRRAADGAAARRHAAGSRRARGAAGRKGPARDPQLPEQPLRRRADGRDAARRGRAAEGGLGALRPSDLPALGRALPRADL